MINNKYFSNNNKLYVLFIGILILILLWYHHFMTALIIAIFFLFLIIYNIYIYKQKKSEWKNFIQNFSNKLNLVSKYTLSNLPYPLIITDSDGNIAWYNQKIQVLFKESDLLGKNICKIINEFNLKDIFEGKKTGYESIEIDKRFYDLKVSIIYAEPSSIKNSNIDILIYFNDVTEKIKLVEYAKSIKEATMLIEVDNYDEALKTTSDDKKPLLVAEIERTLNGYAVGLNAVIKKYSTNKYFLSVQNSYIDVEMKKKFEVLASIREINFGNMISLTLSIGVGMNGSTPLENYNFAKTAKELALGRGGDQAVVKDREKLLFYGGKTRDIEKRTRVRSRVIGHALVNLMSENKKIFIMGHVNPDMDSLGSAIGIYRSANILKKDCYIILDNINTSIEKAMKRIHKCSEYKNVFIKSSEVNDHLDFNGQNLLVIVDVHNKGHIQNLSILNSIEKYVIIDHHRKSSDFIDGALISYIEPYASSTSELVTELFQYMVDKPVFNKLESEILLAGICVDTKNFYLKTGVRTFEAVLFLKRMGADMIEIKKMFTNDLKTYINKADIIKSAEIKNGIAIAICPEKIANTVLAAQAADEMLNITGIQAAFVAVKIGGDIIISGRSLGDINVQLILESLGGGGHMIIAGAKICNTSMSDAILKLKNSISKYLKEGDFN